MRPVAFALLLVLAPACGRVGYDALADRDAGDDPIDAPIDAEVGVLATCGAPVLVKDFGAAAGPGFHGLEVGASATGFVVAWSAGDDTIRTTGITVHPGPRLELIQTAHDLVAKEDAVMSMSGIGDALMLGIDDPGGPGTWLFALDASGYERAETKYIDDYRSPGHDFVVADAGRDRFVVMATDGGGLKAFTRDHDIHPVDGPLTLLVRGSEGAAVTRLGAGYAAITGDSGQCDVLALDGDLVPVGSASTVVMACHHPSVVAAPGGGVVAAWNCDNDAVWVTGGDPAALPGERAVFGDATDPAENPRLAAVGAGVWYAYQVAGGRLGHAFLDGRGATVSGGEPTIVVESPALRAYDLAVHGDDAFLFWLDAASFTKLWAMKLCPP